ncbi:MAG: Transcriptional regulator [Rhodospirillales bacterium]|jgi:AcrR family transcriptional regulator|nr:Transcriptional regulator [Rhodospirillales bacterium]
MAGLELGRETDTRDRIERSAMRLFVEQGIAETSIREIARDAGVSQGAMYNHFVSKEELAWELFSENFSQIGHELRKIASEQNGLGAKLLGMVKHVFQKFDEDWVLVRYVFFARHLHLNRVNRRLGNPYMVFRTIIAEAVRNGEIPRQDVELSTSMVTGAVIQTIDTKIFSDRLDGPLTLRAGPVAEGCLRMLGG